MLQVGFTMRPASRRDRWAFTPSAIAALALGPPMTQWRTTFSPVPTFATQQLRWASLSTSGSPAEALAKAGGLFSVALSSPSDFYLSGPVFRQAPYPGSSDFPLNAAKLHKRRSERTTPIHLRGTGLLDKNKEGPASLRSSLLGTRPLASARGPISHCRQDRI